MSDASIRIPSPVGPVLLRARGGSLCELHFVKGDEAPEPSAALREAPAVLQEVARQLEQYFAGRRRSFELPLDPAGTDFQRRVWAELRRIPWGQTCTYGELALRLGNPGASRAVGLANGRNPIGIIIPCHRVVGSSGRLTGYAGGLGIKRALLELEGWELGPGGTDRGRLRPATPGLGL